MNMQNIEYVLYGVKIGEPRDYMADLLFVNNTPIDINNPKLIELAKKKGYDRLRTSKVVLTQEPPNFINTIK